MSVEQARQLVARLLEDEAFRQRLESTPPEARRAVLVEEGYGDVRLRHMAQAVPASHGGELTDEEFAAVAGGGKRTVVATITGPAASGALVVGAFVAAAF